MKYDSSLAANPRNQPLSTKENSAIMLAKAVLAVRGTAWQRPSGNDELAAVNSTMDQVGAAAARQTLQPHPGCHDW